DNRNVIKNVTLCNQQTVVKSFKPPNLLQGSIYRYFRKTKARRSYEYSESLRTNSIDTPKAFGYVEIFNCFRLCNSYFICESLNYDFLIRDIINEPSFHRDNILKQFTQFTFNMHQKGVLHLDYSLGNIAMTKENDDYRFHLFDINRMQFGKISPIDGIKNFSRISSDHATIKLLSSEYAKLAKIEEKKAHDILSFESKKTINYFARKRKLKQFFNANKHLPPSYFPWDNHSDQPHVIRDKAIRKELLRRSILPSFKLLSSFIFLPVMMLSFLFSKRVKLEQKINNIGLCLNLDNVTTDRNTIDNQALQKLVDELGVKNLAIRLPLANFDHIEKYYTFIESFTDRDVLVVILQDREHINNSKLLKERLHHIFERFNGSVSTFQIGNAVNRKKWAFTSQDEYFDFFKQAQDIKNESFPSIKLLGSNIIDFDLPFLTRSLFHCKPIHYNGVASQLYVDRRGAPENKQLGFDTLGKINIYHHLTSMSRKSDNQLYITEVNWPLKGMGEWAPAQGDCMVDEPAQAAYLVRYYLMMIASGKVEKCYWHQLIAPGYGLINDLYGNVAKRKAYRCFKFLIQTLDGSITKSYTENNGLYRLKVETDNALIEAIWTTGSELNIEKGKKITAYNMSGERLFESNSPKIAISGDVTYLVKSKYEPS
ncbi:MAG: hypothetical protein VX231_04840, partial [Pseudomonadota bacterium]|nr:hypothetical protein [Pseudomonadota bacterium]